MEENHTTVNDSLNADRAAADVAERKRLADLATKPVKPAEKKPELTKSANEPLTVKASVEARAAVVPTNRWATIKHVDEAFDKGNTRDEVINISLMDAGPPEVNEALTDDDNELAENYSYQQVGPDVKIGMRRGGEIGSVDGFGWHNAFDAASHGFTEPEERRASRR